MAEIIKKPVKITETILRDAHQSLIATKANRIVRAAGDAQVMEFGARRAQGAATARASGRFAAATAARAPTPESGSTAVTGTKS